MTKLGFGIHNSTKRSATKTLFLQCIKHFFIRNIRQFNNMNLTIVLLTPIEFYFMRRKHRHSSVLLRYCSMIRDLHMPIYAPARSSVD